MAKSRAKPVNGYVVWWHLHLQDGHEYGAKCFHEIQDALDFINKERWDEGYSFELYEMGKQIPLKCETEEQVEEIKKSKIVYKIKEK